MFILSFSTGLVRSAAAKFSLKTWKITKTTSGNMVYFESIAPTIFFKVITTVTSITTVAAKSLLSRKNVKLLTKGNH